MKRLRKVMMLITTVLTLIACAVPSFAASGTTKNKAGGYEVPAAITIHVGESKRVEVKEPAGKYTNCYFQYNSRYVKTSGFCSGTMTSNKKAGITFTGTAPGKFTAYATVNTYTKSGSKYKAGSTYRLTYEVNVLAKEVPLKSISLNKTSATINQGKTVTLSVSYAPSNTTVKKSPVWSSSNSNVAVVKNGTVTGKKAGTATITATVGNKKASCKITVKAASTSSSQTQVSQTGKYRNVSDAYTALNSFRTSRNNQWYWNSNNTSKVTVTGLKALKRDALLEKIARTRAEEQWRQCYINGRKTHDRTDGRSCWTAYPSNARACGECLGWGQTSGSQIISAWSEMNDKYAGQGHRRLMLDKKATRVGIACYEKNGRTCWAMCLGY
ncbi:MAG: Ig-like domain-containing protein [Blautia sp.]|nr:Ig-like domain-containing protein [Blautia sp.]